MLNIMIVDDSLMIRRVLTKNLTDMGFKVTASAKDGREAVKLYEKVKPDLVTMDITMPIMNGIESLKLIKASHKDAKVIMITSHGEEKLVMDALTNGAKGYILKPITPEKITQVISKVYPDIDFV